jgi:hypothetical protein
MIGHTKIRPVKKNKVIVKLNKNIIKQNKIMKI